MKKQGTHSRQQCGLAIALVGLMIGIVFPLASNTAASVKQSDSSSISSPPRQANLLSLNRWSSNGPEDGRNVSSIAIDPSNPATIYVGADGGVFKSTNNGESWSQSLTGNSTYKLAIDPRTPTILYSGGSYGVSKSTDGGTSWKTINNGLVNQYGNAYVTALEIDPKTTTTLYVYGSTSANHPGVSKSTDGGTIWHTINNGLPIDESGNVLGVRALAIDPSNPNIIYAAGDKPIPGTFGSFPTVHKSTDGGASWSEIFNGFRMASFLITLAIDPINSNTIYVGGYAYDCCGAVVLKSTNGGGSWSQSHLSSSALALAIDPTNSNIIYAGGNGVFKSADGGQSWSAFSNGVPNFGVGALAIDPVNPSTVYAGTGRGIFKSANSGTSWSAANDGLRVGVGVFALTVSPEHLNTIYTGTGNGFYRSDNNGGSWTPSDFYPLAFDLANTKTIYAYVEGRGGLSKSMDGGATWSSANTGLESNYVRVLAIDSSNSEVIYAATYDGVVFKSTNGGASWNSSSAGLVDIGTLAIDPRNSNIIYAGGSGVFKSTDAGASWSAIGNFYNIGLLLIDPGNSQILYVVANDGFSDFNVVYKSIDGGGNWNAIFGDGSSLVIDPVHPNVIYVGTYYDGVFQSTDGGASWNRFNDGLTVSNIYALAIDSSGTFLHAGTAAGVFDYQFSCTYSTSLASQSFPAGGTSGNVGVTATSGCGWQASSSVSWITINTGNSGTGDGTVSFSVGANAEPFPRTATLNIAGQTFTVNQFGIPPINQVDDTQSFVRQNYLDFLNREPDSEGFAFWTDSITQCGFERQCFEVKRINASAAFFISIEFQQTGYLVYRIYKASYGNLPGTPVPVRLSEFLPDTQQIGQGVIVNQPGWETVLENSKQIFAAEYVQRSRFTSAYPTSLTPGQFVDQLFLNTGVAPSGTDRTAAVNEFGSSTTSADTTARARALRRVADNSTFKQQELNRAFVLMQYFGYLRRNPNDAPEPELNFNGYNFWLNKLNQFNGNFVNAEMVKAFITSTEYRHRFGQP